MFHGQTVGMFTSIKIASNRIFWLIFRKSIKKNKTLRGDNLYAVCVLKLKARFFTSHSILKV